MGRDDGQHELTPEERRAGKQNAPASAQKRRLPVKDIARVSDAIKLAGALDRGAEQGGGESVPSVAGAARNGFVGGFTSGMGATSTVDLALETASVLEEGLSASDHADRMAAYPELQGLEVNAGVAQRFPELAEERQPPVRAEVEEEGAFGR